MNRPAVLLTGRSAGGWYRQTLNQLVPELDFNFVQIDFEPINNLLPYNLKEAALLLEPYFSKLEMQKQAYILANITLHESVQYFKTPPKYFISIADILKEELNKVEEDLVILGTKFTMNHSYLPSISPNTKFISLPDIEKEEVDELRLSYFGKGDEKLAKSVFSKLEKVSSNRYIIGCTELAIAINVIQSEIKLLHLPLLQCKYLHSAARW